MIAIIIYYSYSSTCNGILSHATKNLYSHMQYFNINFDSEIPFQKPLECLSSISLEMIRFSYRMLHLFNKWIKSVRAGTVFSTNKIVERSYSALERFRTIERKIKKKTHIRAIEMIEGWRICSQHWTFGTKNHLTLRIHKMALNRNQNRNEHQTHLVLVIWNIRRIWLNCGFANGLLTKSLE